MSLRRLIWIEAVRLSRQWSVLTWLAFISIPMAQQWPAEGNDRWPLLMGLFGYDGGIARRYGVMGPSIPLFEDWAGRCITVLLLTSIVLSVFAYVWSVARLRGAKRTGAAAVVECGLRALPWSMIAMGFVFLLFDLTGWWGEYIVDGHQQLLHRHTALVHPPRPHGAGMMVGAMMVVWAVLTWALPRIRGDNETVTVVSGRILWVLLAAIVLMVVSFFTGALNNRIANCGSSGALVLALGAIAWCMGSVSLVMYAASPVHPSLLERPDVGVGSNWFDGCVWRTRLLLVAGVFVTGWAWPLMPRNALPSSSSWTVASGYYWTLVVLVGIVSAAGYSVSSAYDDDTSDEARGIEHG